MKLQKVALFALATSFSVSGLAALNTSAAQAAVSYDDLLVENGGDLQRSHWASQAIEQLVDKYGVMSGYPDKKFRGDRTLTRYEMAAALYNVMQYIDKMDAMKQGGTMDTSKFATKEDLRQLSALQMEFKRELDMLKAGQMDLEKRVTDLEKVRVHGNVNVRYRDRIAVTDGTQESSPLYDAANTTSTSGADFTNNKGDYKRDANGLPEVFSKPDRQNVTIDDLVPFRVHSQINVDAQITDNAKLSTTFDMFELGGAVSSGVSFGNGGHNINESTGFLFRKAALQLGGVKGRALGMGNNNYDFMMGAMSTDLDMASADAMDMGLGKGAEFSVGLMNFRDKVNPNTRLTNHFGRPNWVGRGYGLVGWGGDEIALSNNAVDGYMNSASRYWAGGLNASMVDPDSHNYNQVTSPSVAFDSAWGWGKFFVGANYGSVQGNRRTAATGNLSSGAPVLGSDAAFQTAGADSAMFAGAVLPGFDRNGSLLGNRLALPSQYGDGYGVAGLDLMFFQDAFPVRLGVHAMSFLNDSMLDFTSSSRKEISGVLDLGWNENFGITVGVNKSFSGYDRHTVGLLFNNLGGSGFDIQLGSNIATRNGLFNLNDVAAANAGVALGIPFLNLGEGKDNIKLVLSARQSLGDNFGASTDSGAPNQMYKDGGLTVSMPYMNIGGSPLNVRAEYSMLLADAVWQFRPVAHDLSIISSYSF